MKLQTLDASRRQAFKLICRDFHIGTLDGIRAGRVRGVCNMEAGAAVGEPVCCLQGQFYKISAILLKIDPQHSLTNTAQNAAMAFHLYISCRSESSN